MRPQQLNNPPNQMHHRSAQGADLWYESNLWYERSQRVRKTLKQVLQHNVN